MLEIPYEDKEWETIRQMALKEIENARLKTRKDISEQLGLDFMEMAGAVLVGIDGIDTKTHDFVMDKLKEFQTKIDRLVPAEDSAPLVPSSYITVEGKIDNIIKFTKDMVETQNG